MAVLERSLRAEVLRTGAVLSRQRCSNVSRPSRVRGRSCRAGHFALAEPGLLRNRNMKNPLLQRSGGELASIPLANRQRRPHERTAGAAGTKKAIRVPQVARW